MRDIEETGRGIRKQTRLGGGDYYLTVTLNKYGTITIDVIPRVMDPTRSLDKAQERVFNVLVEKIKNGVIDDTTL